MNFRQFIKIKRIEMGRNLNKDAKDFGKTTSYLSIMENGKQPVSDEYREFLCKTYSLDEETLNGYLVPKEITTVVYYSIDRGDK